MWLFVIYFSCAASICWLGYRRSPVPRGRTVAAAAVIAVSMAVGQVQPSRAKAYPLVSWNMYASTQPARRFYEVRVFSDGAEFEELRADALLPFTPGPLRGYSTLGILTSSILEHVRRCRCDQGSPELDAILAALATIHAAKAGKSVQRIELVQVSFGVIPASVNEPVPMYSWSPASGPPAQRGP